MGIPAAFRETDFELRYLGALLNIYARTVLPKQNGSSPERLATASPSMAVLFFDGMPQGDGGFAVGGDSASFWDARHRVQPLVVAVRLAMP